MKNCPQTAVKERDALQEQATPEVRVARPQAMQSRQGKELQALADSQVQAAS